MVPYNEANKNRGNPPNLIDVDESHESELTKKEIYRTKYAVQCTWLKPRQIQRTNCMFVVLV